LCTDLVFSLLVDDRSTFDEPRPPFSEICERAGLEVRGGLVAHDESVWREQRRLRRSERVHDALDDDHARAHEVLEILDLADNHDGTDEQLRDALDRLLDSATCDAVLQELVDVDDRDEDDVVAAIAFAQLLVDSAQSSSERMAAHFVAGMVHERSGDTRRADADFNAAMQAEPDWAPLVDRAAWYASDRGDARRAVSLWSQLEEPDAEELRIVEEAARRAPPRRGRNDPCWCGSGRKLKACHGDALEPIPLADRVPWLAEKAAGYVLRRGGEAGLDLFDLAVAWAAPGNPDAVYEALDDPIVVDLALTELGWFGTFLEERGPLLPEDERDLAATWLDVERTVYEVEAARPGEAVLRDVRTGEQIEVREPEAVAPAVGEVLCGRAVSDGTTRQLIGAVLLVEASDVAHVVALCENHDAVGLCEYAARSA
jgi:hypothetical protein